MFVRMMSHMPKAPRCSICRAPFAGAGGRIMGPMGFSPSRKNPQLCDRCFEMVPMGGHEMELGVLFADIRGFTTLSENKESSEVVEMLNRFYTCAVEVLCRHAIVDKLVGDEVMALYLPGLFAGDPVSDMFTDAESLLSAVGYGEGEPWVEVGVGLAFGQAFVGNVGAGEVKDFTAIGDVVNTAARLQGAAAAGEIVMTKAISERLPATAKTGSFKKLDLKGKSQPEPVKVRSMDRRPR
jgi:adenylate cyclase